MQTSVEVRYAGVVVARAEEVRKGDASGMALFLRVSEPMPVGTTLELRAEGSDTIAIVERVLESVDLKIAGMLVRLQDANAAWALAVANSPDDTDGVPIPLLADLSRSQEIRIKEPSGAVMAAAPQPPPVQAAAAEPEPAPLMIPSGLASAAPTVTTADADSAAGVPIAIPAASEAPGSRKTLMYYGTTAAPAAPADAKGEELPPARALPTPDGRRRTTKQRRRK